MTKRRTKAARPDPADRGPDGAAATSRRTRLVPTEQAGVRASENLDEWLIGGLHARGMLRRSDEPAELGDARLQIAEWFRVQWERAGLQPRVVGSYGMGGGDDDLTDAQAWHRGVLRDISVDMGSAPYMRLIRSVVDGAAPRIHGQLLDDLRGLAICRGQWPG